MCMYMCTCCQCVFILVRVHADRSVGVTVAASNPGLPEENAFVYVRLYACVCLSVCLCVRMYVPRCKCIFVGV
jgi:hypothetical protein